MVEVYVLDIGLLQVYVKDAELEVYLKEAENKKNLYYLFLLNLFNKSLL